MAEVKEAVPATDTTKTEDPATAWAKRTSVAAVPCKLFPSGGSVDGVGISPGNYAAVAPDGTVHEVAAELLEVFTAATK